MIQIYKLRRFVPGNFPTNLMTNVQFLKNSHLPKSLQTLRLKNVCYSPKITVKKYIKNRVINPLSSLVRAYILAASLGSILKDIWDSNTRIKWSFNPFENFL